MLAVNIQTNPNISVILNNGDICIASGAGLLYFLPING